jgi:alpha-ketoglutarate-dependent taurine dioxygenase
MSSAVSDATPALANDDAWTITRLTGAFGAELSGARLRDGFDPAWLLEVLETHLVVVLRDQHLTHAEQVALARALGEPTPAHPVVPGHPDHPEILELDGAKGGRNAQWHTDVTFVATPPAASVLVADVIPETGGDTLWADMRTAYQRLAPAMRTMLDGLEAVHRISPLAYWGVPFDTAMSRDDAQQLFDDAQGVPPVIHPVVRVHPSTGERALFVNPGFTTHLLGMSRIESDGLLRLLHEHATQPELVVRHRWSAGDVVMWDNRATMHYAADDYGTAERRMRRVTLRGGHPVGVMGIASRVVDDPLLAIR